MSEEFKPGQPMFASDNVSQVVFGHFDRGANLEELQEGQPVEVEQEPAETVQLSRAEYEKLLGKQTDVEQPANEQQQQTEEVQTGSDPLQALDDLFDLIANSDQKEKTEEVPAETQEAEPKKDEPKSEPNPLDRAKEYANHYYGEISQIAGQKYGMTQQETMDIMNSLTTEDMAQVAYAKKATLAQQRAESIPKQVRPNPPKTVMGGKSVVVPESSQRVVYERAERNPFTE